jgi:hypothetical protein
MDSRTRLLNTTSPLSPEPVDNSGIPPVSCSIEDAPKITGLSRTRIFDAVRKKELMARKAGRSTIIEIDELRRWVKSFPTKGRQIDVAA